MIHLVFSDVLFLEDDNVQLLVFSSLEAKTFFEESSKTADVKPANSGAIYKICAIENDLSSWDLRIHCGVTNAIIYQRNLNTLNHVDVLVYGISKLLHCFTKSCEEQMQKLRGIT